jgi:hypothetical protein
MLKWKILFLFALMLCRRASAQQDQTWVNGYGHQEFSLNHKDSTDAYFSLGEHDLFVNPKISDNISFLGEFVIRYNQNSPTAFLPSIERSFIRYNYTNNHYLIGGKVHTPVNYWNDTYHHGRVFFPVIDRPLAFNYLVPLHTLGIQLQGQNLGTRCFGYDILVGNGIASTDAFQGNFSPSITLAIHAKPVSGMRIGASYYFNHLSQNFAGPHIGHAITSGGIRSKPYRGSLDYHLYSASFAWFGDKWEILNEASFNQTRTDSLGKAHNFANFFYMGRRFGDSKIPYLLVDYIRISEKDLHVYSIELLKAAVGFRYEFSALLNLKAQIEHTWQPKMVGHLEHAGKGTLGLKLQMAYGF